jgi:hypothetical protein
MGFLVITKVMGMFWYFHVNFLIFYLEKLMARAREWMASTLLKWRMWRYSVVKPDLSLSH